MWCMRYSMTGFPPYPVILATPVITAIGCDDRGDGNPEEQRQPPWTFTQQDGSSLSGLPRESSPRHFRGGASMSGRVPVTRIQGSKSNTARSSGFPSKLENDGAGRRKPPEGARTLRLHFTVKSKVDYFSTKLNIRGYIHTKDDMRRVM